MDELNYEVKCVDENGKVDTKFLGEVLKTLDYAMSFRGIVKGWADIPADIEIGWNYGELKEPSEFGIDLDELLKDQPPTDLPHWLLENMDYDTKLFSVVQHEDKKNNTSIQTVSAQAVLPKKKEFKNRQNSSSSSQKSTENTGATISSEISAGLKMKEELEKKKQERHIGRVDLTDAEFSNSTIVLHKKESVDDNFAYELLKKHIADNFGTFSLVLESSGMLYKFPEEYTVNETISDLEEAFDVQVFEVQPKIKIDL